MTIKLTKYQGATITFTKYFGAQIRVVPDANDQKYLWACVWFPRNRKTLGYFYPAIKLGVPYCLQRGEK